MKKTFLIICLICMALVMAGCSNDSNYWKPKYSDFEKDSLSRATESNLTKSDFLTDYYILKDPHSNNAEFTETEVESSEEVNHSEEGLSQPDYILKDPHSNH